MTTTGGTAFIVLDVGGEGRRADYHSGTGTTQLIFRYTVRAGDADDDGVGVRAASLTLDGAAIRNAAGTEDADLNGHPPFEEVRP